MLGQKKKLQNGSNQIICIVTGYFTFSEFFNRTEKSLEFYLLYSSYSPVGGLWFLNSTISVLIWRPDFPGFSNPAAPAACDGAIFFSFAADRVTEYIPFKVFSVKSVISVFFCVLLFHQETRTTGIAVFTTAEPWPRNPAVQSNCNFKSCNSCEACPRTDSDFGELPIGSTAWGLLASTIWKLQFSLMTVPTSQSALWIWSNWFNWQNSSV